MIVAKRFMLLCSFPLQEHSILQKVQNLDLLKKENLYIPSKNILDPGSRKFEQMNPVSLYVGLTRVTTMGDESIKNSAIRFCGNKITPERMINMTRVKGRMGRTTLNIQRRNRWMEHLINNTHQFHCTQPEERELINWAKREKYTQIQLYDMIKNSSIASDVP